MSDSKGAVQTRRRRHVVLGTVAIVVLALLYMYCRDSQIAQVLDGLRWELPCEPETVRANLCTTAPSAIVTAKAPGNRDTRYLVELRFRGVVEEKSFTGGTKDDDHWQTGGEPDNNTYNVYAFRISDPPQLYYLNRGTPYRSHTLMIDYVKTIEVRGGASLELIAESIDRTEIVNVDADGKSIVVPGVPPAPEAFSGQFIQMDVVTVRVAR